MECEARERERSASALHTSPDDVLVDDDDTADDADDGDGDDVDDTTAPPDDEFNELAVLLMQLARYAENDPAWQAAISKVGVDCVSQLVTTLEMVLARMRAAESTAAVKAAADRTAARADQRSRVAVS